METTDAVSLTPASTCGFRLDFGDTGRSTLTTDAAPPIGDGQGPDSEMLLVAAVANCLAASLAFALRKYQNEDLAMTARGRISLTRQEHGRSTIAGIAVEIRLGRPAAEYRLLGHALARYEDYCVVAKAVRAAVPVSVSVRDGEGKRLA